MNPPSTKIAVALHVKIVNAACLTPRFFIPVEAANLGATIPAIFLSSEVPCECQYTSTPVPPPAL